MSTEKANSDQNTSADITDKNFIPDLEMDVVIYQGIAGSRPHFHLLLDDWC